MVFSNASDPASTVTVTGSAGQTATISGNFRKANVTLTERGSLTFSNTTTYPQDGRDWYLYNNRLYILGNRWTTGTDSVVRMVNVATPTTPTSGANDYRYLTGTANALAGDASYLFAATGTNTHRIAISGFTQSSAIFNPSSALPALGLATDPGDSSILWVIASAANAIRDFTKAALAGYYWNATDATWLFESVTKTPWGLLAVQEDNGANQLASYAVDGVSGATWTSPDSALALHGGADMDPGWAGRVAMHPDGEVAVVPVQDENLQNMLRLYGVDDPYGIYHLGDANLSGDARHVAVGDYYAYVGANEGGSARVYVVDIYDRSAPVVRSSHSIAGYAGADLVAVNGNFLYVLVDSDPAVTNTKPTLKVFEIVLN